MDQREMMEIAKPDQFDLDRLAEDLGKLPDAPLAMPVQELEHRTQSGGLLAVIFPRIARLR
jgi:hypothetical protein